MRTEYRDAEGRCETLRIGGTTKSSTVRVADLSSRKNYCVMYAET